MSGTSSRRRGRARSGGAPRGGSGGTAREQRAGRQGVEATRTGLGAAGKTLPGKDEPDSGGALARAARHAGLTEGELLAHLASRAPDVPGGAPGAWTRPDVLRLLAASERLGLDPLAGEAYLWSAPDNPGAPAQVVVALGGWFRLLGVHPAVSGIEFEEGPGTGGGTGLPAWISCTIHRRDREAPTTVREYMEEARGATGAWLTHPRRMLRHCALVQCARVALGASGAGAPPDLHVGVSSKQTSDSPAKRGASPMGPQELRGHLYAEQIHSSRLG